MFRELGGRLGLIKEPAMHAANDSANRMSWLPPCTANLVVACAYYGPEYRCEVIVPATQLAGFMMRASKKLAADSDDARRRLDIILRWLESAHHDNPQISYLSPAMAKVFEPFVPDFIAERIASMHCVECGAVIESWDEHKTNDNFSLVHAVWDESWHCKQGHLLYSKHNDFVFYTS